MKPVVALPFAALCLVSQLAFAAPPDADRTPATSSESTRFRFGFSLNGGAGVGVASGPAVGLGLRLGAQFSRLFGLYYQNAPTLFLVGNDNGAVAGFIDMNSALASFTPLDFLELSAGPSIDYLALGGCSSDGCGAASGAHLGGHGRVALHLGGRNEETGRRSAFTIGFDAHPILTGGDPLVLLTGGLGAEFY